MSGETTQIEVFRRTFITSQCMVIIAMLYKYTNIHCHLINDNFYPKLIFVSFNNFGSHNTYYYFKKNHKKTHSIRLKILKEIFQNHVGTQYLFIYSVPLGFNRIGLLFIFSGCAKKYIVIYKE